MTVIEYFTIQNRDEQIYWLNQIGKSDWGAGKYLYELLRDGKLKSLTGEQTLVGLLVDGRNLVSFCTFANLDEIQPTDLGPWLGFVYTFPEYRGKHGAGILLDYWECVGTAMGKEALYISTDHKGLYEKYGYEFYQILKDVNGEDCRVYRKVLKKDFVPESVFKNREMRGNEFKAKITENAKAKVINSVAPCGFSCNHCFLGKWCGDCRSDFNCCSFATLYEKGRCPNLFCCREKQIEGCWECSELEDCSKGFYGNKDGGNDCKSQALFIRKYGLENYMKMQDKLHAKYKFEKIQEVLKEDVNKSLEILEKVWNE